MISDSKKQRIVCFALLVAVGFFVWVALGEFFLYTFLISIPVIGVTFLVSLFFVRHPHLFFIFDVCFAFLIAGVLFWSSAMYGPSLLSETHRYRYGVDVQTPSGVTSSSSMVEVVNSTVSYNPFKLSRLGGIGIKRGEAVFSDLGEGRCLIALLEFRGGCPAPAPLLPWIHSGHELVRPYKNLPEIEGRIEMTGKCMPVFIYMSDVNAPETMQVLKTDLSNLAGEGYKLKNVWVEITEDEYEPAGIEQDLSWLNERDGPVAVYYNVFRRIGLHGINDPFRKRSIH